MIVEVAFAQGKDHLGFARAIEKLPVICQMSSDVIVVYEEVVLIVADAFREVADLPRERRAGL